jgi:dTDP-4-dehydrorhamnose reductase
MLNEARHYAREHRWGCVSSIRPDIVINAAAYTAVDKG